MDPKYVSYILTLHTYLKVVDNISKFQFNLVSVDK